MSAHDQVRDEAWRDLESDANTFETALCDALTEHDFRQALIALTFGDDLLAAASQLRKASKRLCAVYAERQVDISVHGTGQPSVIQRRLADSLVKDLTRGAALGVKSNG